MHRNVKSKSEEACKNRGEMCGKGKIEVAAYVMVKIGSQQRNNTKIEEEKNLD